MRLAPLLIALLACSPTPKGPPKATHYSQAAQLIPQLRMDNPRMTDVARLLADQGNSRDKHAASLQLIGMAETIARDDWRDAQLPTVRRTNQRTVSPSEELRMLKDWQRRHFVRVYEAMNALGGDDVLTHCKAIARDERRTRSQRQLAIAVLEDHDLTKRQQSKGWGMPTAPVAPPQPSALGPTTYPTAPPANVPPPAPYPPAPPAVVPTAPARPAADAPIVKGGRIDNVNQVVDALRPYFKACYLQALRRHGHFAAWIMLDANVVSDGSVRGVRVSGDESVPYYMNNCLSTVVASARFTPPHGGGANVEIPLSFVAKPGEY